MSSSIIFNGAPMPYLRGIRDASRGVNVRDPEELPTHLPHFYIYAEKGPTEPTYVAGDSLTTIYGQKTLDPRYPYYTHQTVCASVVMGEGNGIFVQRVIPVDAGPKSRVLLSLDVVSDDIQQFQRDASGKFVLDSNGSKIPLTGAGATKPGYRLKWVVNSWTAGSTVEEFGQVSTRTGGMTNANSEQSTLYPIMEFEVSHIGAYGNNIAVRLVAPTSDSSMPVNTDALNTLKAYIYRLQILQRSSAELSPQIVDTIQGDQWVEFALKSTAIDTKRDVDYSFADRLIDAYQDLSSPGVTTPIYGPFGRQKLYEDNLRTILQMIAPVESAEGTLPELNMQPTSPNIYFLNLLTGVNPDNVPYYTVRIEGPSTGGFRFSENSHVYAAGGSDGTMNNDAFDLLVRNELQNYGTGQWPMLNWAKYPVSAYYDTGFKLETKQAFCIPMSKRKDVAVILSTHVVGERQLSASEESSMAMSLNNMLRNFPESTLYGTSVVRALIVGHSGKLINSSYRDYLPLTIEVARKFAAYMGAGNGIWRSTASFDQVPNNQVTMFTKVNVRWKPELQRYRDWDNGLVWVEDYDRSAKFFPALQTVYSDDTSVLNSAANMWIAVDLEKVAQRAWRDMVGNSKLSDEQFLERSDELILEAVRGRYDSRAVIIPRTYYTAADKQRGYSWSCEINMYVGSMKTAGSFTIVARRLSDLGTEA